MKNKLIKLILIPSIFLIIVFILFSNSYAADITIKKCLGMAEMKKLTGNNIIGLEGVRDVGELAKKEYINSVEDSLRKINPNFKPGTISKIGPIKTESEIIDLLKKGDKSAVSEINKFVYKKMGEGDFDSAISLLNKVENEVKNINIDPKVKENMLKNLNNFEKQVISVKENTKTLGFLAPPPFGYVPGENVELFPKQVKYVVNGKPITIQFDTLFGNDKILIQKGNHYAVYSRGLHKIYPLQGDIGSVKNGLKLGKIPYGEIGTNGLLIDGRKFFYENGKWILSP